MTKDFLGRQAMQDTPLRARCVTLLIDGPPDADPWGREALLSRGQRVGRLTSGGYAPSLGTSIALGYVRPDLASEGTELTVRMQGALWSATITCESPFDPTNTAPRRDS